MTYQNDDRRAVVRHLQEMLRAIEITSGKRVTVPLDGIYGSSTGNAVRAFQEENGLPITGAVDQETYDLLYARSLEADFAESEPLPIYLFEKGRSVQRGETSDFVLLLKGLLNELSVLYDGFLPLALTNTFDEEMEDALQDFQTRNRIAPTGIIDKATWNAIVRNYNRQIQGQ